MSGDALTSKIAKHQLPKNDLPAWLAIGIFWQLLIIFWQLLILAAA